MKLPAPDLTLVSSAGDRLRAASVRPAGRAPHRLFLCTCGQAVRPRRAARRRGQRTLQQKRGEGLAIAEEIGQPGRMSAAWEGTRAEPEGEVSRLAAEDALLDNRFEESLERLQRPRSAGDERPGGPKRRVVEAMLMERPPVRHAISAAPALA